jgi:hypothetical protein
MTVTTTGNTITQTGNGATTVWPFNFYVPDPSELVVQLKDNSQTPPVITTLNALQYSAIFTSTGGSVTYSPAIPATTQIIITRVLPLTQTTKLTNQDGFFPATVEQSLDYITMLVQQVYNTLALIVLSGGGVPSPGAPDIGSVLTATGVGSYGWVGAGGGGGGGGGTPDLTPYMQKAANLNDVNDIVQSRNNLGLGSAATLNVGTSANQIVQLDGTGKMPAVDGSQMTNLPGGVAAGVLVNVQVFASSGTYARTAGVTRASYRLVGAGGGSPAKTSTAGPWTIPSGGGAEVREGFWTPAATTAITIGVGSAGGAGGSSVISGVAIAAGGGAGSGATGGASGYGGGSGGSFVPWSTPGSDGSTTLAFSGIKGGETVMGPSYIRSPNLNVYASSVTPGGYGAGSTGGVCNGGATGSSAAVAGAPGICIIYEYR